MRADAIAGGFSVEMKVQRGGTADRKWGFDKGETENVKLSGDIGN